MKIKNIFLIPIILFLSFSRAYAQESDKSGWYAFFFPEKLSSDSSANIGKIVLEPPAGKHGFTLAKEGDLYFEDGILAKFYGINLCFGANFPDKKEAIATAERLAFFGFNAVRLHHMDYHFEPNGIFEDICPAYKDKQLKKTSKLSLRQLQKLDYLIYQLKQKGIYVDINLLVARHFTEADGVKDAEQLGMAAKPASMFDPTLISLQKEYARQLLTHENKFTKLKYTDDPAVALIEITNENSVIAAWYRGKLSALPEYYLKELQDAWNTWLKYKYEKIANLKTAWLKDQPQKKKDFKELLNNPANCNSWIKEEHGRARFKAANNEDGQITLDVASIDQRNWDLQFKQNEIYLKKDAIYTVTFKAKADKDRVIHVSVMQDKSPWANLGLDQTVNITKNLTPYRLCFSANEEYPNARLTFQVAQEKGGIVLEDISLKETTSAFDEKTLPQDFTFDLILYAQRYFYPKQAADDMVDYLIDLEKSYFKEMIDYLRNDLGVKVPVTGIGGYNQSKDLLAQEPCDFIDAHSYWDHPRFPNKGWDMNDFRIDNRPLVDNEKLGIISSLSNRAPFKNLKPYTVTEWNHCYPNQYAYETPMLLAAEANKAQWDGLFLFAYSHGWGFKPDYNNIHSYFDAIANPQKLLLCAVSSFIFQKTVNPEITVLNGYYEINSKKVKGAAGAIKNKTFTFAPFTIEPQDNGAVFVFSPQDKPIEDSNRIILVAIGDVKNTGSYWGDDGKFQWGHGPVLLKQMNLTIKVVSGVTPKLYELDNKGNRGDEITGIVNGDTAFFFMSKRNTPWFEIVWQDVKST
ncbi:MAG: carbohydrate binding domain-containing protein [Candidatus Omnitrophota bacterium]